MANEHAALRWVQDHFPNASSILKGMLILAYGAGLDAGMAEAQDIIQETQDALQTLLREG